MDYKEKYEQALERARQFSEKPYLEDSAGIVEYIFPELKESEDENIRKKLIGMVKCYDFEGKEEQNRLIAYLEKQGEQKPVPKFEEGDVMRTLQEAAKGMTDNMPVIVSIDDEYYHCTNELIAIKDQDDYEYPPMNKKQHSWSEEDEAVLDALTRRLEGEYIYVSPHLAVKFLKSLKDRVLPQPNQEWSEEDKRIIDNLISQLGNLYARKLIKEETKNKYVNWLKSLSPQSQWKPSESDILLLERITNGKSNPQDFQASLYSLIEQLKKLKE